MKIKPGPNYKYVPDPNPVIEIPSSSEDEPNDFDYVSSDESLNNDDVIEISDDDQMEVDPNEGSEDDDRPLSDLVGSRQSSTDREVSGDDIDLDKVRWASSEEDSESEDPCLDLRGPNPMVPGESNDIFIFCKKFEFSKYGSNEFL